jgi:hypothetical protein
MKVSVKLGTVSPIAMIAVGTAANHSYVVARTRRKPSALASLRDERASDGQTKHILTSVSLFASGASRVTELIAKRRGRRLVLALCPPRCLRLHFADFFYCVSGGCRLRR